MEDKKRGGPLPKDTPYIVGRDGPEFFIPASVGKFTTPYSNVSFGDSRCKISGPQRITVDKRTHRIRYENETEGSVTVVIERKE